MNTFSWSSGHGDIPHPTRNMWQATGLKISPSWQTVLTIGYSASQQMRSDVFAHNLLRSNAFAYNLLQGSMKLSSCILKSVTTTTLLSPYVGHFFRNRTLLQSNSFAIICIWHLNKTSLVVQTSIEKTINQLNIALISMNAGNQVFRVQGIIGKW